MRIRLSCILVFLSLLAASAANLRAGDDEGIVLQVLQEELERSYPLLRQAEPAAYFLSYSVQEVTRADITATNGGLMSSGENKARLLDVQVRVGSYELDSSRQVPGDMFSRFSFAIPTPLPVEDDREALVSAIWPATNKSYEQAAETFLKVRTSTQVKAASGDEAGDFTREEPVVWIGSPAELAVDRTSWEERLRGYARVFRDYPEVHNTNLQFTASAVNNTMVTSEGTRLQFGTTTYYLQARATTTTPDGMELHRYASFYWRDPGQAPPEAEVVAKLNDLGRELEALRGAPLAEPYGGPALLSGRAAGVFFHEVFGHRVEGHRQKNSDEAQTFAKKINERVMPEFVSVYDDPTRTHAAGEALAGHYRFDDEGVEAERVGLVEDGVLRNFLLSRSPLKDFPQSNGHGRRQIGLTAVARQGNLIVEASQRVPNSDLRELLLAEVKRQGKPYGLIFEDIEGGFTFTGRQAPQVYQVIPLVVYRVYADGRPDELVRGVDFVGTPLLSLEKILAVGDQPEVFNGICGAESGAVPVSAVSPPLLVAEIEVQKKASTQEKPPLLPPPAHDPQASGRKP